MGQHQLCILMSAHTASSLPQAALPQSLRCCHDTRCSGQVIGRKLGGAAGQPVPGQAHTQPHPGQALGTGLQPSVIALMGGLLPFGSIFIEMYFVFTSFWNYKARPPGAMHCTFCSGWCWAASAAAC